MTSINKTISLMSLTAIIVVAATTSAIWIQDTNQDAASVTFSDNDTEHEKVRPIPPVGTEEHLEWIEWYRTANLDEMSALTRDAAIIFHDFEVDFHPDGRGDIGGEVAALLVQKARLGNTYNPTTNELLLHDWLLKQYDVPKTIPEIDAIILEIVGMDNIHRAEEVYDTLNDSANTGYVPTDLYLSDKDYWHWEQHIAMCDLFWDDCDAEQLRADLANNRELTEEEIEQIEKEMAANSDTAPSTVGHLPEAYALIRVDKYNYAYINVWADTCTHRDSIGCDFRDYDSGTGQNFVEESSTNHRDSRDDSPHTSSVMHFQASVSTSHAPDALSQYVAINGHFTHPNDGPVKTDYGTTGASISDYRDASDDSTFGAQASTYASVTYN